MNNHDPDLLALTGILMALQFGAFGWRIVREIEMGDRGQIAWFPISDWVNVVSMFFVIIFAVILPLAHVDALPCTKAFLAAGFVLIGFHPLSMAAHYGIFSRYGRQIDVIDTSKLSKMAPWEIDTELPYETGSYKYCQVLEGRLIGISFLLGLIAWFGVFLRS